MNALILALITAIGTYLAFRVPNPDDLTTSFRDAQRFYSSGAYDQAIELYEKVAKVRTRWTDVMKVRVKVGGSSFPVREAASYQIGNAYAKLYEEFGRFARETYDLARRKRFKAKADSAFSKAIAAFRHVVDTATDEELKVLAYQRLVELYYDAGRYEDVLRTARQLLAKYPEGAGAVDAYYNIGWSYYHLKDYPRAIDAFRTLLEKFPAGYRADRSLFQIGECYLEQGRYMEAVGYYQKLIDRQHIQELTEAEIEKMRKEKLAGLVDETALELAAKAQIRIGTCYTKAGRYEEGLKAYRKVIDWFPSERKLVEEAYLRIADLYQEKGNVDLCIRTYRRAIEESKDRTLKARVQYALAERFLSEGRYREAVREYRVYLKAYGDIARSVGFPPDRVRYRIGSAYQKLAQRYIESGDTLEARKCLALAISQYDSLCALPGSPYALDARFNRGLAYQTLGTEEAIYRAVEDYKFILREAPHDPYAQRALVQLAKLYFEVGEYSRVVLLSKELLERYPKSEYEDNALIRMALSYQAEGKLDSAISAFLSVPKGSPYFVKSRLGAGHAYVSQGRNEEAIRVLSEGVASAEDDEQRASFHYLLGRAHEALGNHRKAIDHFTRALSYTKRRELEEALYFSRANAAFYSGDYDLAERDFRWITKNVKDEDKVRSAENVLALCYLRQNKSRDAIRTFARMAERAVRPEEKAELLASLLDLYYNEDDYKDAIRIARQLIALNFPDEPLEGRPYRIKEKAYFILGDVLNRLGRGDEAADMFRRVLELYPDSYFAKDIKLMLGTHYFARGELDSAWTLFAGLLKEGLDPESTRIARFYLANIYYSSREFRRAEEAFRRLLEDYPRAREMPDILFGLAESLYQLGRFQEALEYYRRIVGKFPGSAPADDAQYNTAWCLIELGKEDEAMDALRQLLRRYPESEFAASAQFTLGDYLYNRGRYREAMEAYRKVLERYPDDPVAVKVSRLIKEVEETLAYQKLEQGIALMDSAEATDNKEFYERAIEVFQGVLDRYPDTESAVGALGNIGVCLEGLGRWREAVKMYDKVIELYEQKRASRDAWQFAKVHKEWIVKTRL